MSNTCIVLTFVTRIIISYLLLLQAESVPKQFLMVTSLHTVVRKATTPTAFTISATLGTTDHFVPQH